jgi:hypothetical protein
MTNKEIVKRNIGLTFDFVRYLIENPNEIENLPDNFILEFVDKDFPKKVKRNRKKVNSLPIKYVRVRNSFELLI